MLVRVVLATYKIAFILKKTENNSLPKEKKHRTDNYKP